MWHYLFIILLIIKNRAKKKWKKAKNKFSIYHIINSANYLAIWHLWFALLIVRKAKILRKPFMFGSFHFCNFVFLYFGQFSCVIFLEFVSILNFCLAYLALFSKKVNKHDYVLIFLYFRNFHNQIKKWKMELKAH